MTMAGMVISIRKASAMTRVNTAMHGAGKTNATTEPFVCALVRTVFVDYIHVVVHIYFRKEL